LGFCLQLKTPSNKASKNKDLKLHICNSGIGNILISVLLTILEPIFKIFNISTAFSSQQTLEHPLGPVGQRYAPGEVSYSAYSNLFFLPTAAVSLFPAVPGPSSFTKLTSFTSPKFSCNHQGADYVQLSRWALVISTD
jgi:hypothetical protein